MSIFEKRIIEDNFKPEKQIILRLDNLTKKFGKFTAVNNINIEVTEGETIGLVGPNGAGKTTTIKMIAKLLKPSSGKVVILIEAGVNALKIDFKPFGFFPDFIKREIARDIDLIQFNGAESPFRRKL